MRFRDASLQPAQQVNVADAFDHPSALENDRQVNVRAAPHESLGHDSYHGADLVIEAELPADDARVTAELALPKTVTEDGDRRGNGFAVAGLDGPPQQGRHAHDLKRVRRAVIAPQPLRIPVAGPQHVCDRRGDHSLENGSAFDKLEELVAGIVDPVPALARVPDLDAHQAVHILVGERVQHDRVDHAVNRGGSHDPQREREHRHDGEPGLLEQHAQSVAKVTHA